MSEKPALFNYRTGNTVSVRSAGKGKKSSPSLLGCGKNKEMTSYILYRLWGFDQFLSDEKETVTFSLNIQRADEGKN